MDERLMIKVKDQSKVLYCPECKEEHKFRYSHLKLAKGKRYSVYIGVNCYTEYLGQILE